MKVVLCFVILSVGVVVTDLVGECFMAGFYMELGCTPVASDTNSTCPAAFSCPDLHPDPTMCYYRGTAYGDGAQIPESQILASCSQACSCTVRGAPRIECASVDCVEIMNSDESQQCVNTFELDSCCSTGTVCGDVNIEKRLDGNGAKCQLCGQKQVPTDYRGKDAVAELKTCEVDGKTYYEGQQVEPVNTGKVCVCTADWDGKMDSKSCKDINCGLELHHQDELMEKCAPVFYGKRICPIEFQCPSATSKVIRGLNLRYNVAECAFGNYTLRVGDEVSVDDKCMVCTCKMPPFVSCSRKNDCSN